MSKKQEEIVEETVVGTEVMTGATFVLRSIWDVERLAELLMSERGESEPTLVSEETEGYDGAIVRVLWGFRIHDASSLEDLTEYAEKVSEHGEFEIVDD